MNCTLHILKSQELSNTSFSFVNTFSAHALAYRVRQDLANHIVLGIFEIRQENQWALLSRLSALGIVILGE